MAPADRRMPGRLLASPLGRALFTAAFVGTAVSLGHELAPGASWWSLVHAMLPAAVFATGAWGAGHRVPSAGLVARGCATVAVVALSFTIINDAGVLAPWARIALNYVVPLAVSTIGARAPGPPV
ncbi:MAG: hypothetical protein IPK60_21360 [Sandaracinaceae bacterium]|nr:hypothetical protein [Sandaracinaceae bacterium]